MIYVFVSVPYVCVFSTPVGGATHVFVLVYMYTHICMCLSTYHVNFRPQLKESRNFLGPKNFE